MGINGGELGSASGIPVTNQLRRYDVMVALFYKKKCGGGKEESCKSQ